MGRGLGSLTMEGDLHRWLPPQTVHKALYAAALRAGLAPGVGRWLAVRDYQPLR